jgi:hypothetical protein
MGYGGQSRPFVTNGYSDSGGPSRFFYCSKASKKDRGLIGVKKLKIRSDLTPEQRDYVLAELRKAGVSS